MELRAPDHYVNRQRVFEGRREIHVMEITEFRWKQSLKFCAFVFAVLLPVLFLRTVFFDEISPSAWVWTCLTMYGVAFVLRAIGPWVAGGPPVLLGWMGEILYLVVFVGAVLAASSDAADIRHEGWQSQLTWIVGFAIIFFFIGGLVKNAEGRGTSVERQPPVER